MSEKALQSSDQIPLIPDEREAHVAEFLASIEPAVAEQPIIRQTDTAKRREPTTQEEEDAIRLHETGQFNAAGAIQKVLPGSMDAKTPHVPISESPKRPPTPKEHRQSDKWTGDWRLR